jgi:hypothetical protein
MDISLHTHTHTHTHIYIHTARGDQTGGQYCLPRTTGTAAPHRTRIVVQYMTTWDHLPRRAACPSPMISAAT